MRGPQRFDCWRFRTWDAKLSRCRVALWKAEALLESSHAGFTGTADDTDYWRRRVLKAEARVTRALAKRNTWKQIACENCRSRVQRSKA